MKYLFVIGSLLAFAGCSSSSDKKILSQPYSFLAVDGEVRKMEQRNDTLYMFKCYTTQPCLPTPVQHYKILSSSSKEGFVILKLKGLDSVSAISRNDTATNYAMLAFKNINNKEAGLLPLRYDLSKKQLDTATTDIASLKEKFFFTYFSDSYLKELSSLKKITTLEEIKTMTQTIRQDSAVYKPIVQSYTKTQSYDMYAVGINSEILNRVCIRNGYNPFGAGEVFTKLTSNQ